MASDRFDVDPEWAKSIEGLPMAVPEYWWVGYTRRTRCFGKIKKVNCNAPNRAYFMMELTKTPGVYYGMRYDDVVLYADETHADYKRYDLPADPPLHPKHEPSVTVRPGHAPPRPTKL